MTNNAITVIHSGIEITYDENNNVWKFELRGRERKAESLVKAKEAIDKPEPISKKKFEPIAGFMLSGPYNKEFEDVSVTSIVERGFGLGTYVWVSKNGSRSKERLRNVYQDSPENRQTLSELLDIINQMTKLEEIKDKKIQSLKPVDISAWEASK